MCRFCGTTATKLKHWATYKKENMLGQGGRLAFALSNLRVALGEAIKALEEDVSKERSVATEGNGAILTLEEGAEMLRVSPATLRRRWKNGTAPFVFRDGPKMLKVGKLGLEKWINQHSGG